MTRTGTAPRRHVMKRLRRLAGTITLVVLVTTGAVACTDETPAEPQCVVDYSLETLTDRDFAFDGTIVHRTVHAPLPPDPGQLGSEHKDYATFDVHEWFTGGSQPEVRIALDAFDTVMRTGLPTDEVGQRLLVSGDDGTAWLCGFTRRYTQRAADTWRKTFGS